jgi:D-alanyl-D-alanine carboxypeptidase/D-alanyl-D-alanine-endopeptidase (penicillin-binding protein 4)
MRATSWIALVVFLSACAAKSPPRGNAIPVARGALEQLQQDLRAIFSSSDTDHAFWGVSIRTLKEDAVLFSMNATRMQTPASNQKVITSAVAAERLGWDFRYTTRVFATGPQSGEDLNGDLVIVSDGDPTINPRHPDRWGVFDAWAKELHARGIRRVRGELIGDDNAFAEPGWGVGWAWDDLSLGYGAAVGGLQYHENQVELLIGPGLEAGARAIVSVSPPGSGLILDKGVITVAEGQPNRVSLQRVPGSNVLTLRGQVAIGSPVTTELASAPNPTILYLNAFRDALDRHDIFVDGYSVDIDDAEARPDYSKATLLIEDRSPTIGSVIDVCLKWSRNEYAETLLHSLAPASGGNTAAAGLTALSETLDQWGIARSLYVARDGSGLSRNDYVAPDALIAVLTRMWRDPRHMAPFRATLPQAAVSGTLANRLRDTPAAERVWAKTGTMSNVRSLSGYIMTLDNEPLVFAIMATSFRVPASQIDAVMDEALVRLVKYPRELHEESRAHHTADLRQPSRAPRTHRAAKANDDIHVLDIAHGSATRLTFDGGDEFNPDWSHDGAYLLYGSNQAGAMSYRPIAEQTSPTVPPSTCRRRRRPARPPCPRQMVSARHP